MLSRASHGKWFQVGVSRQETRIGHMSSKRWQPTRMVPLVGEWRTWRRMPAGIASQDALKVKVSGEILGGFPGCPVKLSLDGSTLSPTTLTGYRG